MTSVTLHFPINPKLSEVFPKDPLGDVEIIFQSDIFTLQKQYLIESSEYFRRIFKPANCLSKI